ncbi:MAG: YgiQ family radical SAM protein [Clostridia bacterium]|nr:YgiQ family radical SAM protein [Clostridia bacterium]
MAFLPINKADLLARGWDACDFVLVTGDAYVDHPSFGTAVISRVLEDAGFRVCILSQPRNDGDYRRFGTPRLGFLINSGNIDSMVAHYTAAKKRRSDDAYTPGGRAGARPDRALTVYANAVRRLFPNAFIAVGGLEASLRRFAHYDYWSDTVMPSVLLDCKADLLMYGMGEKHVVEIARRLAAGETKSEICDVLGTCVFSDTCPAGDSVIVLPSFEEVSDPSRAGKRAYADACRVQQAEHDSVRAKVLVQAHGNRFLVQNAPMPPLSTEEMDRVYALPYERTYHPSYEAQGGVPGIEEVQFSIIHNRGCYGACNFCSLAFHQGRTVTCRSHRSVLDEAKKITEMPSFKGYIHDVGGPTANFRAPSCRAQKKRGVCPDKKCLAPTPCRALEVDHSDYLALLRKLRALPKVKKVFIRSGVRFDYLMLDKNPAFFRELVAHHVSGQLKVAPEHCSERVLSYMGKPNITVYENFKRRFEKETERIGKKQFLVPYLMSSHPGSRVEDAIALAEFLKKEKMHPQQVQDFYPTPGTVSTCMFYTGLDPFTMQSVYVPKTPEEKAEQRALLQYFKRENRALVKAALKRGEREDLIGTHRGALIPPDAEPKSPAHRHPKAQAVPTKKKNSAARAAAKQKAKRQKKG